VCSLGERPLAGCEKSLRQLLGHNLSAPAQQYASYLVWLGRRDDFFRSLLTAAEAHRILGVFRRRSDEVIGLVDGGGTGEMAGVRFDLVARPATVPIAGDITPTVLHAARRPLRAGYV
jgi:hypothetical protein